MRGMISADWHLRSDRPRCRLDDNWETFQKDCIREIVKIANEKNCDLFIVGDLFDSPTVPARIVSMTIRELSRIKNHVHILAGNHDLPYHSKTNIKNSSMGIFYSLARHHSKIRGPYDLDQYGTWSDFNEDQQGTIEQIKFIHTLVFPSIKEMPPNVNAVTASDLLATYPKAKWIFTGDMHKAFHYENKNRHVVNPGCINRQAADFLDYQPSVYFVDTDENEVTQICLGDILFSLVTDDYLKAEKERDNRIDDFIDVLKKPGDNTYNLDYLENVKIALRKNKKILDSSIIDMVNELIEGDEE